MDPRRALNEEEAAQIADITQAISEMTPIIGEAQAGLANGNNIDFTQLNETHEALRNTVQGFNAEQLLSNPDIDDPRVEDTKLQLAALTRSIAALGVNIPEAQLNAAERKLAEANAAREEAGARIDNQIEEADIFDDAHEIQNPDDIDALDAAITTANDEIENATRALDTARAAFNAAYPPPVQAAPAAQPAAAPAAQPQPAAPALPNVATTSEEEKEQREKFALPRKNFESFTKLARSLEERTARLINETNNPENNEKLRKAVAQLKQTLTEYKTVLGYANSNNPDQRKMYDSFWNNWGKKAEIDAKIPQIDTALANLANAERNLELRRDLQQDQERRAYYTHSKVKHRQAIETDQAGLQNAVTTLLQEEAANPANPLAGNPLRVVMGDRDTLTTSANTAWRVYPNDVVISRSFFAGKEQHSIPVAIAEKLSPNYSEQTIVLPTYQPPHNALDLLADAPKEDLWEFAMQVIKTGLATAPNGPLHIERHWKPEIARAFAAAANVLNVPCKSPGKFLENVAKDSKALEKHLAKGSDNDRLTRKEFIKVVEETGMQDHFRRKPTR